MIAEAPEGKTFGAFFVRIGLTVTSKTGPGPHHLFQGFSVGLDGYL